MDIYFEKADHCFIGRAVCCVVRCFELYCSVFCSGFDLCYVVFESELLVKRNTEEPANGMGVLWHVIGVTVSSAVDLWECFLNINSNDMFSLVLIRRFPQKDTIWSMECCRLDWTFQRLEDDEYIIGQRIVIGRCSLCEVWGYLWRREGKGLRWESYLEEYRSLVDFRWLGCGSTCVMRWSFLCIGWRLLGTLGR